MDDVDVETPADRSVTEVGRGRRSVLVGAAVVMVGVVLGVIWGFLAPAVQVASIGDGRAIVLTGESDHSFDALALFLCITAAAGVVVTVALWALVRDRGPRLVVETVVSAVLGSAAAAGIGMLVGAVRYPSADGGAAGEVLALAPGVSTPLALLAGPLAAAVTIVLLATLSPSDDLERATDRPAS